MHARVSRTLLLLSGVTAIIAVTPLAYLLVRVLDAGPAKVWSALVRMRTLETAITSVALAATVIVMCVAIGVPIAWALARVRVPWAAAWSVLLALPLAIPSYVAAYAWLAEFSAMTGFWAAAFVLTLVSMPYVIIPTTVAFRNADAGLEEVARTLGRGPWGTFWSASMPQAWPATAAGALLVGLYVLSDFGAVALFRVDAFTRVIYASYRGSFDRTTAAVLAVVLVMLALLLILAERRVRGRTSRWRVGSGSSRRAAALRLSTWQTTAVVIGLTTVAILAIVFPVFSLIRRLLEGSRRPLDWGELAQAALNTLGVSTLAAIVVVILALPVGILAARSQARSVRVLEAASYTGHALPGVVVGLSLVFFTLLVLPAIYQTLAALVLAYTILFLPKSIGATRTAVAVVPPALEQTARTLGFGPLAAWSRTTLRLATPMVAAGGLLVCLTAMKELPATLMLRPTGFDTLATELWSRTEIAAYGASAPYALALMVLAAVPAWLLSWASERRASTVHTGASHDRVPMPATVDW
ncbi:MAG: iron ABC transporter permease [Actinomycetota bacterium]|nr:iron ABC transporter permease [Actinomycetota bacterium]